MQELVDAAVAAAGRSGSRVAVIIADGAKPTTNGAGAPSADPAMLAEAQKAAAGWKAEAEKHAAQVKDLAQRLEAASKAPTGGTVTPIETVQKLAALEKERDELRARLASAPPAGTIPLGAAQPDALPKLRDYKIDILGLDAELTKKAAKANVATIGQLEDLALSTEADKLKNTLKLTKDQVTEVHAALLRRSRASDAPATGVQTPASAPAGKSDVPHGHADTPWLTRLEKLRIQSGKYVGKKRDVDAAKAALTARWPNARQLDPESREVTVLPANLPPADFPAFFESAMKLQEEEKLADIYGAHVVALRVSTNLEKNLSVAPTVDDALKAAGLVHLMETPPATAQAAPPQGAPATAPAAAAK